MSRIPCDFLFPHNRGNVSSFPNLCSSNYFCFSFLLYPLPRKNGRRHASKYLIDPRPICAAIHRIEGGNLAQPDFFLLFCRYPSERQMREIRGQLRILTQPSHVSPTEKWKKKKEKNAFSDVTRFEVYSGHKVCMGCQSE